MDGRGTEDANRPRVRRGDVADVRHEAVARIERIEPAHHAIPYDLRDDRGGGDRRASRVAVDECAMRGRSGAEPKSVDETSIRRWMEIGEDRPQRGEVRAMQTRAVDLESRNDSNADLRGTAEHRAEERLALFGGNLLGVVQPGKRTDPGPVERLVVEEHPGNDERPCEGAATCLVGARDIPDTEAPVMRE